MSPYDFDGEKYKKASKHQKEWGNRLIGQLRLKEMNPSWIWVAGTEF